MILNILKISKKLLRKGIFMNVLDKSLLIDRLRVLKFFGKFMSKQELQRKFIVHATKHFFYCNIFETKTKEKNDCAESPDDIGNKDVENIDDIDGSILSFLFEFVQIKQQNIDLKFNEILNYYHFAEKYQIKEMMEECVSLMKENLSIENICEAFKLVALYDNEELKKYSMEYFYKNAKDILHSSQWKDFMMEKTQLVAEIMSAL